MTLEKEGKLRGCIGSIIGYRALINDLINHARNAAFKDTRFNPVELDEIEQLKVKVSLLSEPKKLSFNSEKELLEQIIPNVDGLIIKDGVYQAVYLPSVWREIPNKEDFLINLKLKAGLAPYYFSKTFEAFKFKTEYIEET